MRIGIAAHISAAASGPGARRYDPFLSAEQRSSIENGIWVCAGCSSIIDRDEVRFTTSVLHNLRRDHIEFARLGQQDDHDVGIIAIGPSIYAGGQVQRLNGRNVSFQLTFFLSGTSNDLYSYVSQFSSFDRLEQYVVVSELGHGGLLSGAPEIERNGPFWTLHFTWDEPAPRRSASDLSGMCENTGRFIEGEQYWRQTFQRVLGEPTRSWFANMEGGSHFSELYETLRSSVWFEHLLKCELIRLSSVPAAARLGSAATGHPPFECVSHVRDVSVPSHAIESHRLAVNVEFDLQGYGRWSDTLSVFLYDAEMMREERAKALWMNENIRRMEGGERQLPSAVPPEGWTPEDGFPE